MQGDGALSVQPSDAFCSLFFVSARDEAAPRAGQGESIRDLFIDRIFDAAYGGVEPRKPTAYSYGREEADARWRGEVFAWLRQAFVNPPRDAQTARRRQEVAADLGRDNLAGAMRDFQLAMVSMREHMLRGERASSDVEARGWFIDAVRIYCDALHALAAALAAAGPRSAILRSLLTDLQAYLGDAAHAELVAEATALREELDRVRYAVRIEGDQVTLLRAPQAEDFSAVVAKTFARFRQGDVRDHRAKLQAPAGMNHIEAQIIDRVALLHPALFARLEQFTQRYASFADARWLRLDRELVFYLWWWDFLRRIRAAGVESCLPELADDGDVEVVEAADLALAAQAAKAPSAVVCNDFALHDAERMLVVTGPNHGGKTTLARTFGQLHHIAALGLPVGARSARVVFPDRILTHFERAENIDNQRGKLQDDLVRMRAIVEAATARSLVVMNEVFSSTSLDDAVWLGQRMMVRLRDIGCRCIFVTFLDELAGFDAHTVSLVAQVDVADPTVRTFKVVRRDADGKAYARALAQKYRVTREALRQRIAR